MKIIKILLGIILAIVGLFLILGLFAPKDTVVERTVTIKADPSIVWRHVSTLEAMDKWSPWNELDPNQTKRFEGEPGSVGSQSYWEGNDQVGKGSQTITDKKEGEWMETQLKFIEPFEAEAKATVILDPKENTTEVTWKYEAESVYPMNTMNLFINMDDMLGPDFQKGLSYLQKNVMEDLANSPISDNPYDIMEIDFPKTHYVSKRKTVSFEEMQAFFAKHFPAMANGISPEQMAGMPTALYFTWDEPNMQSDLAAAIPVTGTEVTVEGYETITLEAGKAFQIDYYGDYEGLGGPHEAMDAYMKQRNLRFRDPAIEEYITDPETEPDTTKWLTKITYLVKE